MLMRFQIAGRPLEMPPLRLSTFAGSRPDAVGLALVLVLLLLLLALALGLAGSQGHRRQGQGRSRQGAPPTQELQLRLLKGRSWAAAGQGRGGSEDPAREQPDAQRDHRPPARDIWQLWRGEDRRARHRHRGPAAEGLCVRRVWREEGGRCGHQAHVRRPDRRTKRHGAHHGANPKAASSTPARP